MKDIFTYELKKILRNKATIILCILLIVFDILMGCFSSQTELITQETFDKAIENIIYSADVNWSFISDKSSQNALYQKALIDKYSNIKDVTISSNVMGFAEVISSPYPYLSALVFCIWVALQLALAEYSSNIIFLTYKESRVKIGLSKLLMLLIFSFASVCMFVISFCIPLIFKGGFMGALSPIQSAEIYMVCPYKINMITALLLHIFMTSCFLLLGVLMIYISALVIKKFIPSLIAVVAFVGLDFLITYKNNDIFNIFYNYNFKSFFTDLWLKRYSGLKFGMFVSQPVLAITLCLIFTIITALSSLAIFKKVSYVVSVKNSKKLMRNKTQKSHGIIFYEVKKMFRGKTVIMVAILIVFKIIFLNTQVNVPNGTFDTVYKNYLVKMESMSYETQLSFVSDEKAEAKSTIQKADELSIAFKNDECTPEEFLEYQQKKGASEMKISVLDKIDSQLKDIRILRDKGLDARLIYTSGWNELFLLYSDFFCVLAIILVLIPYISIDDESEFAPIINGFFLGRDKEKNKLNLRKNLIMFAISIIITFVFMSIDVLFIHLKIGLPSWNEYAVGTMIDTQIQTLFLWQIVVFRMIVSLCGIVLVILTCNIISKYVSNGTIITAIFILFEAVCMLVTQLADIFFVLDFTSFWGYEIFSCDGQTLFVEFMILLGISIIFYVRNRKKIYRNGYK